MSVPAQASAGKKAVENSSLPLSTLSGSATFKRVFDKASTSDSVVLSTSNIKAIFHESGIKTVDDLLALLNAGKEMKVAITNKEQANNIILLNIIS